MSMRALAAMVRADRAVGLPACSAATRVHSHTTKKIRAIRQLQRASMESRAMSANLGSPRCSVESCQWLRPTRRQEFHGRLRADGSKSGSILNSARLNSATSQFKDIRRLNKAAPTIERLVPGVAQRMTASVPRARHHDSALFNNLLPSPWLRISGTT